MYQMSLFIWPREFLWPDVYNVLHFLALGVVFSLENWLQQFSYFLSAAIQHISEVPGQHFSSVHTISFPKQRASGKNKQLAKQLLPMILVGYVCLLSTSEPQSLRSRWLCSVVSKVGRGPGVLKRKPSTNPPASFPIILILRVYYVSLLRGT